MVFLIILITSIQIYIPNDPPHDLSMCITQDEKELYELINTYRETLDLKRIPFSQSLSKVAQTHVKDLAENYTYKPNPRCNPHSWSKKGNWTSCCYTSDHTKSECMWNKPREIANFDSHGYEILYYSSKGPSPGESLIAWQKSPAHHPVMINTGIWAKVEWGSMGVGINNEYAAVWFAELKEDEAGRVVITCD